MSNPFGIPDPARIAALERDAAKHPAQYRGRVMAMAVLGDVALTCAQILPIALPIGMGLLLINSMYSGVWFYNVAGAAAFVLLVWITRPDHRFSGKKLSRTDVPRLYESLDRIRQELLVPEQMEVRVDADFNASASETKGLFGFIGVRRTLTIGMPLLCALSKDELLSVIAHEYGHFSRRHGRFGHWLYRAREGWLMFAADVTASDSAFDRASAAFASWFVPFFGTHSFVLSRQQEYEADAASVQLQGARVVASALTKVHVFSRAWNEGARRLMAQWQRDLKTPPDDFFERFEHACRHWDGSELDAWHSEALAEPPNWIDTHPRLRERLAAFSGESTLGELNHMCAGEALLGQFWPALRSEFNRQWKEDHERLWLFQHHRFRWFELQDQVTGAVGDQLLSTRALRRFDPVGAQKALYRLSELHPVDAEVAFQLGSALIDFDVDAAMAELTRAMELDASYRFAVYPVLGAHFARAGSSEKAEEYEARTRVAGRYAEMAVKVAAEAAEKGQLLPSPIAARYRTLWTSVMPADPCLKECWMFHMDVPVSMRRPDSSEVATSFPVHVLYAVVQPDLAPTNQVNEYELCDRLSGYMAGLLPANAIVYGQAYFTTTGLPTWVKILMQRQPEALGFCRS